MHEIWETEDGWVVLGGMTVWNVFWPGHWPVDVRIQLSGPIYGPASESLFEWVYGMLVPFVDLQCYQNLHFLVPWLACVP